MTDWTEEAVSDCTEIRRLDNARRSEALLRRLVYFHGRRPARRARLPAIIYPSPVWQGYLAAKQQASENQDRPASQALVQPKTTMAAVVDAVCKNYRVSRQDVIGSRRTVDLVRPRQVAMYLIRKLTPRTMPEIAKHLGNRDHTTILYGYRKIERLIASDIALRNRVDSIRAAIFSEASA